MIQSVDRALMLMDEVAKRGDWVGVRELARITGLKVPTAHNLLKTLVARGYLEFDEPSRRYRVGMAAFFLARAIDPVRRAAELAHPFLEALYQDLGETVVAGIWHKGRLVLVDWLQARHPLSAAHFDAVVEHPHLLAMGKILLSLQDDGVQRDYAMRQPLAALGPNVPRTVEELLAELRTTREQGYGEVINPGGNGIAAVSVAVAAPTGRPALAIGCSAPVSRFDRQRMDQVRAGLLRAAGEIAARLGGAASGRKDAAGRAQAGEVRSGSAP